MAGPLRYQFVLKNRSTDIKIRSVRKRVTRGLKDVGRSLAMAAEGDAKNFLSLNSVEYTGYLISSIESTPEPSSGKGAVIWRVSANATYASMIELGKWIPQTFNKSNVPGDLKRWYEYRFGGNASRISRFTAYNKQTSGGQGLASRFPRGVRFMHHAYKSIQSHALQDYDNMIKRAIIL